MAIVENLSLVNIDLSNNLLLRLPIRYNFVVSSLTNSRCKGDDRRKGEINKSTIDSIKHLLNDCCSSSQ